MNAAFRERRARQIGSRTASLAQDVLLICVTSLFVYAHAERAADGSARAIFFATEQALLVGMFVVRRRSLRTSSRWQDWLAATAGTWLPLALRTTDGSPESLRAVGTGIQIVGLTLTSISFLTLGRSFGIVAANRGLKTHGVYSVVRHPVYLGHSVTIGGLLIANLGLWNLIVVCVITACQLIRIRAEERVLEDSASYADYRSVVRWRLIPGVF